MGGVKTPDWPEPSLLGGRALVETAARAQVAKLEEYEFWHQVAERAVKLRDVISVGDLAAILDALLTANHRHLLLMKTLAREIIDDVDKLSFMEAAVIANAYSHFKCVSTDLLSALCQHTSRLLKGEAYISARRNEHFGLERADPQSIAVLCKALASLKHKDPVAMQALNHAFVAHAATASLTATAEVLRAFVDLQLPFEANPDFWATVRSKVPGSRMSSLCPTMFSLGHLKVSEPQLLQAVMTEVTTGLRSAPRTNLSSSTGKLLNLPRFPPFAHPRALPKALRAVEKLAASPISQSQTAPSMPTFAESNQDIVEFNQVLPSSSFAIAGLDEAPVEEDLVEGEQHFFRKRRWYNSVTRKLDSLSDDSIPKVPYYVPFNAEDCFARNARGARVAQALEGLNSLCNRGPSGILELPLPSSYSLSSPSTATPGASSQEMSAKQLSSSASVPTTQTSMSHSELEFLDEAGPVLCGAVQGLSAQQLLSCTELFSAAKSAGGDTAETVQVLLRESVRKLSNLTQDELRRLYAASHSAGVSDAYLERARKRRFPKALRKELRDNATAIAAA